MEFDNRVAKLFYGRVDLSAAASCFDFKKAERVQRLLHELKYQGHQEVGKLLGRIFGHQLVASPFFKDTDIVIPVPLHPDKKKKRGYNQAEALAEGIAEAMEVPMDIQSLFRSVDTETQTRKSRIERYENMRNVFKISHPEHILDKTILLVDDVVTTGATLEACAERLLLSGVRSVKVATLASA